MVASWIEKVTGSLEDKKRYRQHKARVAALPTPYRTTVEAVERYLMYAGGVVRADLMMTMLDDLGDLFEGAAADGTPVRDVVGDDPVEFVETFLSNYAEGQWISKERKRLVDAVDRAATESSSGGSSEGTDAAGGS